MVEPGSWELEGWGKGTTLKCLPAERQREWEESAQGILTNHFVQTVQSICYRYMYIHEHVTEMKKEERSK